jgi:hypothetical protein
MSLGQAGDPSKGEDRVLSISRPFIDVEVIPTRPERKDGSMRGKTKNLSEWALKSLSEPETLNQRVVGSNPTAPTNISMT